MRKRADWMKPVDDPILEVLDEKGNLQPSTIGEIIGKNGKYIGVRCRELLDHGMVMRYGRGVYSITETGRMYLDGEIDASSLGESEGESENIGNRNGNGDSES